MCRRPLLCGFHARHSRTAGGAEHNAGTYDGVTKSGRPVTLVFSDYFDRITDAIAAERQLKGRSRAKKEALIAGDFDKLIELARGGRT
jgi:putative endonuclease